MNRLTRPSTTTPRGTRGRGATAASFTAGRSSLIFPAGGTRCRSSGDRRSATASARVGHAPGRRRVFRQAIRRTDRPAHEFAAAVGTDAGEAIARAGRAERALVGADHRLARFRRQVPVAALAVGPQFQHGRAPRQAYRIPRACGSPRAGIPPTHVAARIGARTTLCHPQRRPVTKPGASDSEVAKPGNGARRETAPRIRSAKLLRTTKQLRADGHQETS